MTDREPFDPRINHPFSPEMEEERARMREIRLIEESVAAAEGREPDYEIPSPIHAAGSDGEHRRWAWRAERLFGPWLNVLRTPQEWVVYGGWRPFVSVSMTVRRRR